MCLQKRHLRQHETGHVSERNTPTSGARTVIGVVTAGLLVLAAVAAIGVAGAATGEPASTEAVNVPAAADHTQQTAVNESERFSLDAEVVSQCGLRCRTVTANLTNTGSDAARNVSTETEVSAGGAQILTRVDPVGNVSANESIQRTADLSIGPMEAIHIFRNNGRITINTTVAWDGGEQTFTESRSVV